MTITIRYLAILLLLAVSAIAKTEAKEAHVHGLATLTLALENEVLEIEFESPAANLVGFEHKASSSKEKQLVKQAETILKSPKLLFSFVGTSCKPKEATVDVSMVMGSEHKEHQHKEHEEHGKHEEHKHHDHSTDHVDSSHSEITAHYQFSCKDPQQLHSLATALFSQFPKIEKIKALWVTEARQGSKVLSPSRNTLSLR